MLEVSDNDTCQEMLHMQMHFACACMIPVVPAVSFMTAVWPAVEPCNPADAG